MPTNRGLLMPVQAECTLGRLEDPAVARGEAPVPVSDPPLALVGVAVGRPRAQHPIEPVIQTLEDTRAPDASIVPGPPPDDRVEQANQRLLAGMAMALDDRAQVLDMALDRLGTGHDPRLVP